MLKIDATVASIFILQLLAAVNRAAAFSATQSCRNDCLKTTTTTTAATTTQIFSSIDEQLLISEPLEKVEELKTIEDEDEESKQDTEGPITAKIINSRLEKQLSKMRLKDQTSKQLAKEDLDIVHEDVNILVINKPSGVLTTSGRGDYPSLANVVHENIQTSLPTPDHMIVHRLGMDVSGLIIMAKNKNAVLEFHQLFRGRKVDRRYEALVAGHIERDFGMINLPLMMDYEVPPYVRISTIDHQWKLADLDREDVGKAMLQRPKESVTKYEVIEREFLDGQPVTRVILTSISGRYHQLNCHLAAFGHPIVGDTVYGKDGQALENGGLTRDELEELIPNPNRADDETQRLLNESIATKKLPPCVHAKYISFKHPITKKSYEFSAETPF